MKLRVGRLLLALLSFGLVVVIAVPLLWTSDDGSPTEGYSITLPSPNSPHQSRPFPRLVLQNGAALQYLGMFPADAKFRAPSKHNRFFDTANGPRPESLGTMVPPQLLHSYSRFLQDYAPPAHALATPEVHSLAGRALSSLATLAYGHAPVLREPKHVTSDSRQRIIVSDPLIPAVHVIDPARKTSFSILGGPASRLRLPAGVAVDADGNIYVADSTRGMVLVYDQNGRFLRLIGNLHGESLYQRPTGIAIDREKGRLYLVDTDRNAVVMLDLQGNLLKRVGAEESAGADGLMRRAGASAFNAPTEIAVSSGEVAVLDSRGRRIRTMDLDCNLRQTFTVGEGDYRHENTESGLTIDEDGNIYLSDVATSRIMVYGRDGRLLASFGQEGSRAGEFVGPTGLWLDSNSRLYIADTQNSRVQLFQLSRAGLAGDHAKSRPLP